MGGGLVAAFFMRPDGPGCAAKVGDLLLLAAVIGRGHSTYFYWSRRGTSQRRQGCLNARPAFPGPCRIHGIRRLSVRNLCREHADFDPADQYLSPPPGTRVPPGARQSWPHFLPILSKCCDLWELRTVLPNQLRSYTSPILERRHPAFFRTVVPPLEPFP